MKYQSLLVILFLSFALGCNALIDIEQEHPLQREVNLDDQDMGADPPDRSVNNSNNVSGDQRCLDVIRESYPDLQVTEDGEVCIRDGAADPECLAEYEACLDDPAEITCDEVTMLLEQSAEVVEVNTLTDEEKLSLCETYGPAYDDRFDAATCARVVADCF